MKLQIAGFLDNSFVNGEGIRSVVFVSGCKHKCNGCHNETMQKYDYGDKVSIEELYKRIMNNVPLIKGVTFSGGEPFDSAEGLSCLAKKLKCEGLNIWCYTGYKFEEIIKEKDKSNWKQLLAHIDILVDGKFEKELTDNAPKYAGSRNQRIIDVEKSIEENRAILKHL